METIELKITLKVAENGSANVNILQDKSNTIMRASQALRMAENSFRATITKVVASKFEDENKLAKWLETTSIETLYDLRDSI